MLPASPEWFDFMFDVVDSLKSAGKDAACLFLSYGNTPLFLIPLSYSMCSK